jgi:hypothetical protein
MAWLCDECKRPIPRNGTVTPFGKLLVCLRCAFRRVMEKMEAEGRPIFGGKF